jgi:hypothetical protein
MNGRETKTDVHLRLLAIADRMGVPFNSLFREATKDELNAQREQWDALKKRVGKGPHKDVATLLKSLPGRNRPPMKGDELPAKMKAARRAAPVKRTRRVAA